RLGGAVHLHLRGAWAQGFEAKLTALSRDLGADGYVHILPPAPPEQLVERSAQHDIGFAGESGHTANGRLAVSNKMLNYMAAGIAIVASDVPSQRETLQTCAEAGILYRPGDADALANALQRWVDDPDALQRAKAASHRCGDA